MTALLIDIDGVLYVGDRAVDGASDALLRLRTEGIPYLLLTNTTSRPRASIVEKLAAMGTQVEADDILTPAIAARDWLSSNVAGPVGLFVPDATRNDIISDASFDVLPARAETGAAAIVLGDLGAGWDFATYNRTFRLLMAEPRPALLALGMTRYWRAAEGLRLDVGPFVKGLEYATGASAVVLGKPARAFFATALAMLGVGADEAVMIGDDVVGDVGGAQDAGIRGALVKTGKFRPADTQLEEVTPWAVIQSFAAVPKWLRTL